MCIKEDCPKIISIETQMQIKKILFLQKCNNSPKYGKYFSSKNNLESKNMEISNKINNCGSLFVKDFEIRQMDKNEIIKPNECIFNSLSENDLNPFQTYAKLNDINKNKIIDIRIVKTTEEPDLLFFNKNFSQ